jgi:hypothetical protein
MSQAPICKNQVGNNFAGVALDDLIARRLYRSHVVEAQKERNQALALIAFLLGVF